MGPKLHSYFRSIFLNIIHTSSTHICENDCWPIATFNPYAISPCHIIALGKPCLSRGSEPLFLPPSVWAGIWGACFLWGAENSYAWSMHQVHSAETRMRGAENRHALCTGGWGIEREWVLSTPTDTELFTHLRAMVSGCIHLHGCSHSEHLIKMNDQSTLPRGKWMCRVPSPSH